MADDEKKGQPLDPFAEVNDDEWFSAVDEWDSALDLPEETPDADAQLAEHPVALGRDSSASLSSAPSDAADDGDVDPLVSLIDGDMEVDPEGGHALGALLGSAPTLDAHARPTPRASRAITDDTAERSSTSRESPSMEIEIMRGAESAASEIEVIDDEPTPSPEGLPTGDFDEATPPRFTHQAQPEPEPPPLQARPADAAPDDDIDSILGNLGAMDAAPQAPTPAPPPPPTADELAAEVADDDAVFDEDIVTPVARVDLLAPPTAPRGGIKERVRHVGERLETPPSRRPDSKPELEIIDDGLSDPTPQIIEPSAPARRAPLPTTATLTVDGSDPEALLDYLELSRPPSEPDPDVINIGAMLGAPDDEPPPPPPPDSRLADIDPEGLGQDLEPALPALPDIGAPQASALSVGAVAEPAELPEVWRAVAEVLPEEVARADSARLAADLELFAADDLARAGDDDAALARLEEALQHRVDYLPAQVALYGVHARAGRADRLGELGREVARRLRPTASSSLLAACADAAMLSGDDAGARELAREAAESGAGPAGARVSLVHHDLAQQSGDAKEIDDALVSLSALAREGADGGTLAAAIELDRGRLAEREGALEAAIAAYRQALQLRPALSQAWEGIARCAARRDDLAAVADALVNLAPLSDSLEAPRRRRLAQLCRWRGIEGVDADEQVALAASAAPGDPLALESWAASLTRQERNSEAIAAYLQLAEVVTSARERGGALAEAAALAERAGDGDREQARALFAEAAAALPGDGPAAAGVSRLQRHDPDPQRRLEAERAAAGAARGRARAVHHVAAAGILERELEDVDGAMAELQLALEHDAGAADAIAQLERLCRARGEIRPLVAALDTAAEANEADARADFAAEMRLRSAQLYERLASGDQASAGEGGVPGDAALAALRYRAILHHEPDRLEARWGLSRALLASGAPADELAQQIASEAQLSSGRRAADLWARHAELISSGEHADRDQAEASLRLCLGEVEDHPAARELLTMLAAAEGEWSQVADQLRARAEAAGEGSGEHATLMLRVGALHVAEDPPDLSAASAALGDVAASVPGASELLARAYRASGELERLVDGVTRELHATQDPAQRFALLLAAADLARRSGATVEQAEGYLHEALALRPDDPLVSRSLEQLYLSRGEGDRLTKLLSRRLAADGVDASTFGAVSERIIEHELLRGAEDAAMAQAERMLEHCASALVPLGLLRRRLVEGGGADVARALVASVHAEAHYASGSDALSLWLEVGRLIELADGGGAELDESSATPSVPSTAAQAFDHAGLDESHALALVRLLDVLPAAENARRAVATRTLAERTTEGASRAALLARAGELAGDDVETLAIALSCDTEYLGAIYRLREAALVNLDWESALLATEAELAASKVRGRVVWAALLAGELAHDKLGDADRAAGHYRHALSLDPENKEAFDSLRRLLEEGQRHDELSELLEERLAVETSTTRRIELLRQQADIAAQKLGDRELAKGKLRALLELDAEDNRALSGLGRLYEADEQWTEAADALMRQCRLEVNPRLLIQLYRRLGMIYEEKLPDRKRAIAAYKRVVALDARDIDGQRHLSDLYLAELEFEHALAATKALFELETDHDRRIDHLLRIAKIYEDGLRDGHQSSLAFRRANDMAPADLKAIGALCGFFARQGDQRSMMVHLDRSVAAMRSRLEDDPFEAFAYHALFRIFGWRKSPDACLVVAQLLDLIGEADEDERALIEQRSGAAKKPGTELGSDAHDDRTFDRAVPGGFRRIFEMLGDAFGKIRRGDVRSHGVGRSDRITDSAHPVRRIADALASDFGVPNHTLYISKNEPTALLVENTDPPSIIVGEALLSGATEPEIRFLLGRCLWIARKSMVLPTRLRPEDLALLVAGVVRQYVSDFEIPGIDHDQLLDLTKQVARVIPRRMKQELMPFALECSGKAVELRGLGAAVIHSANRAGLLACGNIRGALLALRKAGGKTGKLGADVPAALADNPEIETLVRFAVSDDYFELRRAMGLAVR